MTTWTKDLALRAMDGVRFYRTLADILDDATLTMTAGTAGSLAAGNTLIAVVDHASYLVAASAATDHDCVTTGGVKLYAYDKVSLVVFAFSGISAVTAMQVPVGCLLRVSSINATYTRAPDAATDAHLDYSGSGGVKWYVLPSNGAMRARDFGVKADGVSDDTVAAQHFATALSDMAVLATTNAYTMGMVVEWGGGTILLSTTITISIPQFAKIRGGAFRYIGSGLGVEDPLIYLTNAGDNYHGKYSDWYDLDLDCGSACSGIKVDGVGRFRLYSPKIHRHMGYAWTNPNSRENWVINPQISQWTAEYDGVKAADSSYYTADGLRVAYTDTKVVGGETARNKVNVRLLAGSGITKFTGSHIYNQSLAGLANIRSELGASDEATFSVCYLDNGQLDIYGDRVNFLDCEVLFNAPLGAFDPTFINVYANNQSSFSRINIDNMTILGFPSGPNPTIAALQTPSGAGALTLVGGGTVTFPTARLVQITATGNETGKTFTITGTNASGGAQSEVVTGPNANTVASSKQYLTVSSVVISAAAAAAVSIGTNVLFIDWLPYGANTWAQDFTKIKDRLNGVLGSSQGASVFSIRPAAQELVTFQRNGAVKHLVSAEDTCYLAFEDTSTLNATSAPRIGAKGNDLSMDAPAGKIAAEQPFKFANGTIAYVTANWSATTFAGCYIEITDGGSGGVPALCNATGGHWVRVTDGATVI